MVLRFGMVYAIISCDIIIVHNIQNHHGIKRVLSMKFKMRLKQIEFEAKDIDHAYEIAPDVLQDAAIEINDIEEVEE